MTTHTGSSIQNKEIEKPNKTSALPSQLYAALCLLVLSTIWRLLGNDDVVLVVRDEYRAVVLAVVVALLVVVLPADLSSSFTSSNTLKFLLAGAVAGIVSRTAVSPLEVIATLQMVRGKAVAASSSSTLWGELVSLYATEGFWGFFKGNFANCVKVAPSRGIQFFAFESIKRKVISYKQQKKQGRATQEITLAPLERLIAGGVAGMFASCFIYPIEVVKTMLTLYPENYYGIFDAFRGVVREVGYSGLYAGLAPTLIAMFPYVGVEFMIYETTKIAAEALYNERRQQQQASQNNEQDHDDAKAQTSVKLPIIVSLGLGAMAGAAAQTSAHPLDVIRKRLQVQGLNGNPVLYANLVQAFAGIIAKEGFGALYNGLGPACVATIPGTGISYIFYEFMKNLLGIQSV